MAVPLATSEHPPQGDQPTYWRAPSQETAVTTGIPPAARGTVASLLVHVPAALRECRAHGPHIRRTPPAGDRPEERRAPTQRLEGTNPRTGRRYLLTLSVTTSSSWTSAIACSRSFVAVVFWLGVCRYWAPCSHRSILPPCASLFVRSRFSAF